MRLSDDALKILGSVVGRRTDGEHTSYAARDDASTSYKAAPLFSTLPGAHQLRLQRSAASALGLSNPFFRVHEGRAGATTQIDGRDYINFSSYDYLGLNGHERVHGAAHEAIERFGTSASASRLVAGERTIHGALETALADHYGQEAAILFVSGYLTNLAVLSTLLGPKDLILHDALAHNSTLTGAAMSGAQRRSFPHNDLSALEGILVKERQRFERVLIVVEGLYSMDGDHPDLAGLVALKARFGCWLMVDTAHDLGVLGERGLGLFEQEGVDARAVDIWMGTLSKTLAGCGGFIAGSRDLVDYLKCMAPAFIYSVGLAPPLCAGALAALQILHEEPGRVQRLQRNSRSFWSACKDNGFDVGLSRGFAVVPVLIRNSLQAVALSHHLFERGINVQPIIHPAVPEQSARLRFFITHDHTADQLEYAVTSLAAVSKGVSGARRSFASLG